MSPRRPAHPPVILYSTMLHRWEVWHRGTVQAHASTPETCQEAYPQAKPITERQYRLARKDADA